jgi:uncharacterized protein YprB with RNaseH-like and TPR domain
LIARSFIHLPRIGYGTERRLWRSGVRSWRDFVERSAPVRGISTGRWSELQGQVRTSLAALQALDHSYFSSRLPPRDHWRALQRFRRKTAYLDIETTGLGGWADVTVVGVYDGLRTHTYIHGENLDELADDLGDFALLVTYNGAAFDLPFLQRRFPGVEWNHLHVDFAHLDGFDAVRLWNEYQAGSDEALELLVRYNTADITNLEVLAERVYGQLSEQVVRDMEAQTPDD